MQRHIINGGFEIGTASKVFLPLTGYIIEQTTPTSTTEYISFVAPCDGYVEYVIIRSEYPHGTSIVGLHKASNNTESPSGTASNTKTIDMCDDDISFKFEGGTAWSFSAGDSLAISFDPGAADTTYAYTGDISFTIVFVFDWNNPLDEHECPGSG
jgi:hypothetical protein